MEALLEASSALLTSHELEVLLPGILDIARKGLAADAYAVWRSPGGAAPWRIEASRGLSPDYAAELVGDEPQQHPLTAPLILDQAQDDPRLASRRGALQREGIRAMAAFPLLVNGATSGTIVFYFRTPHTFTREEIDYARTLANLASAAIGNAELFALQKQASARANLLARVSAIVNSSLDYEATVRAVANAVAPEIADWCSLSLFRDGKLERIAVAHADPEKIRLAEQLGKKYPEQLDPDRGALRVMRTLEPELVTSITDEMLTAAARSEEHLKLLRGLELHSYLSVPLRLGENAVGVLRMGSSARRPPLSERDVALAKEIASRAVIAIENARLHEEERENAKQLQMLNSIGQQLAAELDQGKLLQTITDVATQGSGAQFGAFFYNVYDAHGGSYVLYTISGVDRAHFSRFPMPRNTEVFGPTFRGEGTVRSDDITQDPRYGRNAPHHGMPPGHLPVRSYLAVPVKGKDGVVIGGLFFGHERVGVFTEKAARFIEAVAAQAGVALTNALLYKRAQDEITRRIEVESQLERERQFLSLSQKVAGVGSWELDLASDPVTAVWSPELQSLYGLTPGTFGGLYQLWIDSLHPDDRQSAPESVARAIAERRPWEHEFRIVRPDGAVRWLAGRGQCFYDDDGRPVRMIGVNIDTTERKLAEDALRRSEKLSAAGRLAATIAHEINNPLEAVTNLLFLAKAESEMHAARLLEAADQELRRVAHIARQTLGFYRESASPNVFDAGVTVEQVISLLSRHMENRRISPRLETRHVSVTATEGEIRQVISNLVMNAIDASAPESPLRIKVGPARIRRGERLEAATRITVADYGQGISKETLRRICEPFFTTKKDVGTGLGLWVSKEIVEKHRGRLQVRSQVGRGAVFSVLLPRELTGEAA